MRADPIAMFTLADEFRDMSVLLDETLRQLDRLELEVPTNDYLYHVARLPEAFDDFRLHWSSRTGDCVSLCRKITDGLMEAGLAIQAADADSAAQVRG